LDLTSHAKSSDAKAAHHAACNQIRLDNRTAERAWDKEKKEVIQGVEKQNQELLKEHSIRCAYIRAEYQKTKEENDRYMSNKRRLEAKVEQAQRSHDAKAESNAKRNLRRLERERENELKKKDTDARAAKRAEKIKEAGMAVAQENSRLRKSEKAADEDKKKAYLDKLEKTAAAITVEFGDPFEGLDSAQRKQRVLEAYFYEEKFYIRTKDGFLALGSSLFEEMLEIHAGYKTANPKGVYGVSPAKRARNSIQTTRLIHGVGHYTWLPAGRLPVWISGENRIIINSASQQLGSIVSPLGLNTASKDRVKCSHPEEVWRS
jgi:hypothetical protein